MKDNADKLGVILNKDFGLMDEVHTQGKDLRALQAIKGQRYQMLIDVYIQLRSWINQMIGQRKLWMVIK